MVAEEEYIAEPLEAIALLAGAAFVLFLIHVYIGVMTERSIEGARLGPARTLVVIDNLPLLGAIVVPVTMFLLAEMAAVSLSVAYTVSVGFSIVALLFAGAFQGRAVGFTGVRLVLSSLAAAGLGLAMVMIEAVVHGSGAVGHRGSPRCSCVHRRPRAGGPDDLMQDRRSPGPIGRVPSLCGDRRCRG